MPRRLPPLANHFIASAQAAQDLIMRLEAAHVYLSGQQAQHQIGLNALELSYELAYLRIFTAWEEFQEQVFLRRLCGYEDANGYREPLVSGQNYRPTLALAESAYLGGLQYKLWHDPVKIVARVKIFFVASHFATVIGSRQAALGEFAAVRHRVAHSQKHARSEFDAATMSIAARRYSASRPRRFLRDWKNTIYPRKRWIASIADDLGALARQICP